ncbi:MAG: TIGR02449 family protein [Ectothiorhodospiraceae bacterium]|nr:TIGR02449 family protein [Chromatiales bacterium]MCP5156767.1 TIGR02449 family protein [Ectothiorhodospiraceae bacterium]
MDPTLADAEAVRAELKALDAYIDRLVNTCNHLAEENRALRDQQANLIAERATLIEKSELARSRVEAMIARLKAMEVGT